MAELYYQAGEDPERYRELLHQHGYLIRRGEPGFEEAASHALPCGWSPGMQRALASIDEGAPRRERIAQAQADPWCEKFDMPASGCAHCRGISEQPERDPADYGPWFAARYPGKCAGCGEPIREGDRIRGDGTGHAYLCSECGTR